MSKSKGDTYERRLVNFLDRADYFVMRSPSSGSATTRDQPDLLAFRTGDRIVIEAKYEGSRDGIVYLSKAEVDALCRVAHITGADPVIAVRWSRDPGHYIFGVHQLQETGGTAENLRVTREMCGAALDVLGDIDAKNPSGRSPEEVDETGVAP